jgi:hypothetical protein
MGPYWAKQPAAHSIFRKQALIDRAVQEMENPFALVVPQQAPD